MPDLNFDCPNCGQNIDADTSLYGMEVDCPGCGATIQIPEPEDHTDDSGSEDGPGTSPNRQIPCSHCGSLLEIAGPVAGGVFECPACLFPVQVPEPEEPEPEPELPQPAVFEPDGPQAKAPRRTRRSGRWLVVVIVCISAVLIGITAMWLQTEAGNKPDPVQTDTVDYVPPSRSKERLERLAALRKARDEALEQAPARPDRPDPVNTPSPPDPEPTSNEDALTDPPPPAASSEIPPPPETPPPPSKTDAEPPAGSTGKSPAAPPTESSFQIEPGPLEGPDYFDNTPKPPPFAGKGFRTIIRVTNKRQTRDMPELDLDEPTKRHLRALFPDADGDIWHFVYPGSNAFQPGLRETSLYIGFPDAKWRNVTPPVMMKFWEICYRARVVEKGTADGPPARVQRTWTDETGQHSRVATLVSTDVAEATVTLRSPDDSTQTIPLAKLSAEDRRIALLESLVQRDEVQVQRAYQDGVDYFIWPAFDAAGGSGLAGSPEVRAIPFHFFALKPPVEACVPVVLAMTGSLSENPVRSITWNRFTATVGNACQNGAYFSRMSEGFLGNSKVDYRILQEGSGRAAVVPVNSRRQVSGTGIAYFVVSGGSFQGNILGGRSVLPSASVQLHQFGLGRKCAESSNAFTVPFSR